MILGIDVAWSPFRGLIDEPEVGRSVVALTPLRSVVRGAFMLATAVALGRPLRGPFDDVFCAVTAVTVTDVDSKSLFSALSPATPP